MKLYIAASFRSLHAVRLFQQRLSHELPGIEILDWTELAAPPLGLTPAQRREWMNTDLSGEVFRFCEAACGMADLVVYFGQSGQDASGLCPSRTEGAPGGVALRSDIDAGVEVGLARAAGVPILGILGPLEAPGLMLFGVVSLWVRDIVEAIDRIKAVARCDRREEDLTECASCPGKKLCNMAPTTPGRKG